MKCKRKRIWIDNFQTRLSLRIAAYFVLYQAIVLALLLLASDVWDMCQHTVGRESAWYFTVIGLAVFGYVGFAFIYDAVKFSHRIVGPLVRIRRAINAVTAGEAVDPVNLRNHDFLQEIKDELNNMLTSLEQRGAIVLKTREPLNVPQRKVPAEVQAAP